MLPHNSFALPACIRNHAAHLHHARIPGTSCRIILNASRAFSVVQSWRASPRFGTRAMDRVSWTMPWRLRRRKRDAFWTVLTRPLYKQTASADRTCCYRVCTPHRCTRTLPHGSNTLLQSAWAVITCLQTFSLYAASVLPALFPPACIPWRAAPNRPLLRPEHATSWRYLSSVNNFVFRAVCCRDDDVLTSTAPDVTSDLR